MGLLAENKPSPTGGVAIVALFIALCAAALGTARWGLNLSDTWAWAALFVGVFAVGMSAVRVFVSAEGTGISLVALTMAGAAIASPWVPIAPVIGLGGLLLLFVGV